MEISGYDDTTIGSRVVNGGRDKHQHLAGIHIADNRLDSSAGISIPQSADGGKISPADSEVLAGNRVTGSLRPAAGNVNGPAQNLQLSGNVDSSAAAAANP